MNEDGQGWNHVLIYAGVGDNGERMWVHSSGGEGVIFNTPSYESTLSLRRPKDVDLMLLCRTVLLETPFPPSKLMLHITVHAVNAVVKTPVALLQVESQWHKEWLQCPATIRLEHKS